MKREDKWCPLCRETTVHRFDKRWMCDKCHPEIKETNMSLDSGYGAEAQTQKEMP